MAQPTAQGAAAGSPAAGAEAGTSNEPVRAPTLESIKAERRASAEAASNEGGSSASGADEGAQAAASSAKPKGGEGKAKPKAAEVDIDDAKLAGFVKLNTELRDAKMKLRELEPTAAQAAKIAKATKLISEGKNFDAIREVVGEDVFNAAVREVVGAGGDGKPKVDPEVTALKEKIAKLEEGQTGTKKQLDDASTAQREVGIANVVKEVTALTDQFPYLSRNPEWVRESLKRADKVYEVAAKKSIEEKGRDLNNAEKNALLRAALEVSEEEHAETAKLYGAPAAKKKEAPTASTMGHKKGAPPAGGRKVIDNTKGKDAEPRKGGGPRTVDNTMRGNVTSIIPKKKSATLEELKRERRMRS